MTLSWIFITKEICCLEINGGGESGENEEKTEEENLENMFPGWYDE
jgi:hypothetical protein